MRKNLGINWWTDVVLGVLFVVSGFVKAIDPMGFSYKIEEYLGMFQLSDWGMRVSKKSKYPLIESDI